MKPDIQQHATQHFFFIIIIIDRFDFKTQLNISWYSCLFPTKTIIQKYMNNSAWEISDLIYNNKKNNC